MKDSVRLDHCCYRLGHWNKLGGLPPHEQHAPSGPQHVDAYHANYLHNIAASLGNGQDVRERLV